MAAAACDMVIALQNVSKDIKLNTFICTKVAHDILNQLSSYEAGSGDEECCHPTAERIEIFVYQKIIS